MRHPSRCGLSGSEVDLDTCLPFQINDFVELAQPRHHHDSGSFWDPSGRRICIKEAIFEQWKEDIERAHAERLCETAACNA